jgi:hypothetical protein
MPKRTRTFGKDKRGDETPDWASDKEKRLAKIQEAMARARRLLSRWGDRWYVGPRPAILHVNVNSLLFRGILDITVKS